MRRAVLATVLVASCQFQHGSSGDRPDARLPYPSGDGPARGDALAADTGQSQPSGACHTTLPGLVLCLDFETPTPLKDAIGHTVDFTSFSLTTRGTQGAAKLAADSSIYVESRSDLNVSPNLTIEMWIEPHSAPSSSNPAWLVSSSNEYGLWLTDQGLECGVSSTDSSTSASTNVQLPLDQWTHVACVYDGTSLKLYIGGNGLTCSQHALTIDTSPDAGISISNFDGAIDDVHVYASAASDQDICHVATGGFLCKPACP